MVKKQKLYEILTFPLNIALGGLFFSLSVGIVRWDVEIMQMGLCFAFGMSLVTLFLVFLYKDELVI